MSGSVPPGYSIYTVDPPGIGFLSIRIAEMGRQLEKVLAADDWDNVMALTTEIKRSVNLLEAQMVATATGWTAMAHPVGTAEGRDQP